MDLGLEDKITISPLIFEELNGDEDLVLARKAIICSIGSRGVIHLEPGSYLSDSSTIHSVGYVGDYAYMLHLHFVPVVSGHVAIRLAISTTETIIDFRKVAVTCQPEANLIPCLQGSIGLCNNLC